MQELLSVVSLLPQALVATWWFWLLMSACVGSFLTMLVHRWPMILDAWSQGQPAPCTFNRPRSHCPACQQPLAWYQNIPLLGFFLSRLWPCCSALVSPRYLMLEAAAVLWGLGVWFVFAGQPLLIWTWSLFGWMGLAVIVMDYQTQWLPDGLSLGLLWLGLGSLALSGDSTLLASRILQVVGVYLALRALLAGYESFKGLEPGEAMGGGDIKLMAAFAAWFSLPVWIAVFTLSCFVQVAFMTMSRKRVGAFGPALMGSAMLMAILGQRAVVLAYFSG